jgi:hypothetical protein
MANHFKSKLRLGALLFWGALGLVLACCGLGFVHLKNEQMLIGERRGVLEKEIDELKEEIAVYVLDIERTLQRSQIESRLERTRSELGPVAAGQIIDIEVVSESGLRR